MCADWKPHETNKNYIMLTDPIDALVRVKPLPDGYLWQCGKRYGYAISIEEAKAWAEGLADHYSLKPEQRWMTL